MIGQAKQSYTSQVLQKFEKKCSIKPFEQTKNGLVCGRSSKTEILNKIFRNLNFDLAFSSRFIMFFQTKNLKIENNNP